MLRTHKIALDPTGRQRQWFAQQCGYADVAYNFALKVTSMLKNRKIAKALSDSALGGFLAVLKKKADARGVEIVRAPHFFASSKTCSYCGDKKDDLKLADRVYRCDACGYTEDRDVNAAINLRTIAVGRTEM